jgi:hypothetical protein
VKVCVLRNENPATSPSDRTSHDEIDELNLGFHVWPTCTPNDQKKDTRRVYGTTVVQFEANALERAPDRFRSYSFLGGYFFVVSSAGLMRLKTRAATTPAPKFAAR